MANKEKIMRLVEDLRNVIDGVKELDKDNTPFVEYGLSALTILSQELNSIINEIWEMNE